MAQARKKATSKPKAKPAAKKKAAPKKSAPKKPAPKKPAPKKSAPKKRAKPAPKTKKKPAPRKRPIEVVEQTIDAVPEPILAESSTDSRRLLSARERSLRSLPVVEILDDPHPIGALRRFLDSIRGEATSQQSQIALGSAQLMLLPIAREHRGGSEVKEVVDLMLQHWPDFGERRRGFHAQEFLRNALAAIGVDRDRIGKLEDLIPPGASSELLFNLACAHAVARDKVAMLRAVERALEAGISPSQFRRDHDFAPYARDPDLAHVLARAEVPAIPVDVEPYISLIRGSLDILVATLREYGESIELHPPVRLDAILDAERARKISLPNDYRALLTITNGMALWEHTFLGVGDYREPTPLAQRAQHYLEMLASFGRTGLHDCVPIANWGQPNDWLLYDRRGFLRGGDEPGYVLMLNSDEHALSDLSAALQHLEYIARETFGTN